MDRGFDCYGVPSDAVLKRAFDRGFRLICPYYGTAGSSKVLTADGARRITAASLLMLPVFEVAADRPLHGRAQGSVDAAAAMIQARAAGQPHGTTICFAVDGDVDAGIAANRNALIAYFGGAKDTIGPTYRVGAYGSGAVLTLLLDVGLVEISWLAGASRWRGSQDFDRAGLWDLKQHPTIKIGAAGNELGIEYDPNDVRDITRIGAWSLQEPVEPPDPIPVSRTGPIDLFALQRALAAEDCYSGPIDGIARTMTAEGLIAYSRKHPPSEA